MLSSEKLRQFFRHEKSCAVWLAQPGGTPWLLVYSQIQERSTSLFPGRRGSSVFVSDLECEGLPREAYGPVLEG